MQVGAIAVAIGLVVRGQWRHNWSFATYFIVGLTMSALMTSGRGRFYESPFYLFMLTVLHVLKFAIALEVAWRTFQGFRGGRAAALRAALAIVAATALAAALVPIASSGFSVYETALAQFHPRVINGTLWLMVATLVLAQWYRVPIHPFHAVVLTGFAIYLAVYSVLLGLVQWFGLGIRSFVNMVDTLCYLALMSWWLHAVWRRDNAASAAHVEISNRLEASTPARA